MSTLSWIIWCVVGTMVLAVIFIILWQIGVFNKQHSPPVEIQEIRAEIDQKSPTDTNTTATNDIDVSGDYDVDNAIKQWLKPPKFQMPITYEPMVQTRIFFDEWKVQENSLKPHGIPSDAQFGYSLDTHNSIVAVGAPGIRTVYVYHDINQPPQELESKEEEFGCNVVLSDNYLFIQSKINISIFTYAVNTYVFSVNLILPSSFYILDTLHDTLFITDQSECQTLIYELVDMRWTEVLVLPKMLMSVAFDEHVWAVSAEGLSHWSKNLQGEWTEDAVWLMNTPLTTVTIIDENRLALGEAHNDQIRIVDKTNPEVLIEMFQIPGGTADPKFPSLFGDRMAYWQNMLFVSQPLDMNGRGGFVVYDFANGMKPMGMQIGESCTAQHASQIKQVSSRTLLVTTLNSVSVLSILK